MGQGVYHGLVSLNVSSWSNDMCVCMVADRTIHPGSYSSHAVPRKIPQCPILIISVVSLGIHFCNYTAIRNFEKNSIIVIMALRGNTGFGL